MSDHKLRFSRRRVLQIAGLAPLAALAGGGMSEAALTAGPYKKIHPKTMKALIDKSGLTDPQDKKKFEEVVEEIWIYCRAGAKKAELPLPEPDPDDENNNQPSHARLLAAYSAKNVVGESCGDLVVQRLRKWDELRELTNVCAFNCGVNAAEAAQTQKKLEIDDAAYQLGFTQTELDMKKSMNRLRSMRESQGKPAAEFIGGGC